MIEATMEESGFEGWCILELIGHRRLAGYLSAVTVGGAPMVRIDIPLDGSRDMSPIYSASAIYCLTPTTEETARATARRSNPEPLSAWDARSLLIAGGED